jgi:DNA replication protein DnaC
VTKLREAKEASVLVLDDLGQEAPELKDDVVDVLTTREEQSLFTVVTTGLSLATLETTYGAQFARRLTAKERVWWLALGKAKGGAGG